MQFLGMHMHRVQYQWINAETERSRIRKICCAAIRDEVI